MMKRSPRPRFVSRMLHSFFGIQLLALAVLAGRIEQGLAQPRSDEIAAEEAVGSSEPPPAVGLPFTLELPENVDGSRGIPADQAGPMYEILKTAASQSEESQKAWARFRNRERNRQLAKTDETIPLDLTSWDDIVRSPDDYRGQLVTIRGRIRAVTTRDAESNDAGIRTIYEVRFVASDAGQPVFVFSTSLPEGMPVGDDLSERGSVTGYFFKLQSYVSEEDKILRAPLVLSRGIDWEKPGQFDPERLSPQILSTVRRMTRGIPDAERDSYYRALAQVRDVDQKALASAARKFYAFRKATHDKDPKRNRYRYSQFADLFKNAAETQGEAVTIRGHMRKLVSYPAGDNDFGIRTLHEAWIYPEDSSSNPVVAICLELPEGMAIPGERDVVEGISVTGYYFKQYVYGAEDTLRRAPMILSKQLGWTSRQDATIPAAVKYGLAGGGLLLIVGFVVLQSRSARREREFQRNVMRKFTPESSPTERSAPTESSEGTSAST